MTRRSKLRPGLSAGTTVRDIAGLASVLCVQAMTCAPMPAAAQADPLAAFGERMVGTWEADDSRHVFEWGVGERVIKSTSYFPEGGGWTVVSEGWWYWDPGVGAIRGTTIAVGMGIDLFEYTTRTSGDQIVHGLVAHGDMGGTFTERWTFDGDGYTWDLEQDGRRLMGGAYRKVR